MTRGPRCRDSHKESSSVAATSDFGSLVPDSLITFEHAVLLLLQLARAVDLRPDVCVD